MKKWALLLSPLLLTSCLLQRVLVAKLDSIIEYKVSHTMQLYVAQDRVLEKDVPTYLNAQHAMAPTMIALIKSIDVKKPEESTRIITELLAIYRALDSDFRKILVKHLLTLDASQRKTFFKNLKKENEETLERLNENQTDRYHERMEYFIGELTSAQAKILAPHEQIFLERDRERLVRRKIFQAKIKDILERKDDTRQKLLLQSFLEYQAESATKIDHLVPFLKDLTKSLTKEQKAHFEEKRAEILEMVVQFSKTNYE